MVVDRAFIRKHFVITLPLHIRKLFPIQIGDPVEIYAKDNGEIIIRPLKVIDASQAWFLTRTHQAVEAEAETELKAGKAKRAKSAKELIDELNK